MIETHASLFLQVQKNPLADDPRKSLMSAGDRGGNYCAWD